MQRSIPILLGVLTVSLASAGCVYVAHQPESLPKEQIMECYAEQSNLIGTWQLAESCNWAWGDGCVPIPESERRNSYEFRQDGTCLHWIDDTTVFELDYQVVFGENRLSNRPACLLTVGTAESRQTWAFSFKGHDTLSMSLMAHDAGSATYVRAF